MTRSRHVDSSPGTKGYSQKQLVATYSSSRSPVTKKGTISLIYLRVARDTLGAGRLYTTREDLSPEAPDLNNRARQYLVRRRSTRWRPVNLSLLARIYRLFSSEFPSDA
jgi:hypothetical protein